MKSSTAAACGQRRSCISSSTASSCCCSPRARRTTSAIMTAMPVISPSIVSIENTRTSAAAAGERPPTAALARTTMTNARSPNHINPPRARGWLRSSSAGTLRKSGEGIVNILGLPARAQRRGEPRSLSEARSPRQPPTVTPASHRERRGGKKAFVNRLVSLVIFALVFLAAVPRVAGVYGDFWLDEIWSWRIAANIAAPKWILLHPVARYDNNHPLNTLTMWLSGHHVYSAVYRVPAVMSGIGTIVVAAIVLRRRGVAEMFAGVLLVGFACRLVSCSSEARGYAPAVFFALVAFDALDRYLRSRGWFANLAFVLACVLGIAAHLTFVYFWAAAVV